MALDLSLSRYAVGGAARVDSFSGMNPRFSTALADMFAAAPPEIRSSLRVSSGYRSVERQSELFEAALEKYGSPQAARKWVAAPGHSMHNHGLAADLKYLTPAARQWAHANADRFGLTFPLANENWHIELAGARDDDGNAATTIIAALDTGRGAAERAAAERPAAEAAAPREPERRSGDAPSVETQVALFLLTLHEPPRREVDERQAALARRSAAPPIWWAPAEMGLRGDGKFVI